MPVIHILLVLFTMMISSKTPEGAYYRIEGIDPVGMAVGMIFDGATFWGALLVIGTGWWYFIGKIGYDSHSGRINRFVAPLGALLALFSGATCLSLTTGSVLQDLRDHNLPIWGVLQYACAVPFCVGAFITTVYAMMAFFRKQTEA
jgi:hypothetical protein